MLTFRLSEVGAPEALRGVCKASQPGLNSNPLSSALTLVTA